MFERPIFRLLAAAAIGMALATAAAAMTPTHPLKPPHWTELIKKDPMAKYDPKILLSRGGCGFGQVMGEDGKCESRAGNRQERRQERRCARHSGGKACEQDKL